jgi:hypothetical protein
LSGRFFLRLPQQTRRNGKSQQTSNDSAGEAASKKRRRRHEFISNEARKLGQHTPTAYKIRCVTSLAGFYFLQSVVVGL